MVSNSIGWSPLARLSLLAGVWTRKYLQTRSRVEKVCTKELVLEQLALGCDSGWRLRGQFPTQLAQEHLVVFLRLGVAGKDQFASIGGREMHVEHLDGSKLLQQRARRQPRGQRLKASSQMHVQTIGQ